MYHDAELWEIQIPKRYAFYFETQKTVSNKKNSGMLLLHKTDIVNMWKFSGKIIDI